MSDPISYFTFQEKTTFIPLRYVYGECFALIEDHPQMYPLKCMVEDGCPANVGCGDIIVRRIHYLFEEVMPDSEVIIAYFKYRDRPKSIRGVIFNRDLEPPTISILNPWAFRKFQKRGIAYQWYPTDEYLFMQGSSGIIPVERLVE